MLMKCHVETTQYETHVIIFIDAENIFKRISCNRMIIKESDAEKVIWKRDKSSGYDERICVCAPKVPVFWCSLCGDTPFTGDRILFACQVQTILKENGRQPILLLINSPLLAKKSFRGRSGGRPSSYLLSAFGTVSVSECYCQWSQRYW